MASALPEVDQINYLPRITQPVLMLNGEHDNLMSGEASSGRQAVGLASRLRPDVVLLDLEMPDVDGVEAIPQLLTVLPGLGVLVFTGEL